MLSPNISNDPKRERAELFVLGIGLIGIALVIWVFLHGRVFPGLLTVFALIALTGVAFQHRIGHDVYLVFALIALALGRIVSPVIVFLAYIPGIGIVGSLLRLAGMNKLKRDFAKCRTEATMFINPSTTTDDGFRRQS